MVTLLIRRLYRDDMGSLLKGYYIFIYTYVYGILTIAHLRCHRAIASAPSRPLAISLPCLILRASVS